MGRQAVSYDRRRQPRSTTGGRAPRPLGSLVIMDPIKTLSSVSALAITTLQTLQNVEGMDSDRTELVLLAQQVKAVVEDSSVLQSFTKPSTSKKPFVQRALEGLQQAWSSLSTVVGKLSAQKGKLVQLLLAGDFRPELQKAACKLHDSFKLLSTALESSHTNSAQQALSSIRRLRKNTNALQLKTLAQFAQDPSTVGESVTKVVLDHVERLGTDMAYGIRLSISQQLLAAVQAALPSNLHALMEDKQALAKELQEMKAAAQLLRLQGHAVWLLEGVIAALSSRATAQPAPPNAYICRITGEIMTDPVETSAGYIYERWAIESWLRKHFNDPCTTLATSGRVFESSDSDPESKDREPASAGATQVSTFGNMAYASPPDLATTGSAPSLPWQQYMDGNQLDWASFSSDTHAQGPAFIDFAGQTVTLKASPGQSTLTISSSGLTLCNGTIRLPANVTIFVEAENVTFQNLQVLAASTSVKGRDHGVVEVCRGPFIMQHCHINGGCAAMHEEDEDDEDDEDDEEVEAHSCIVVQQSCGQVHIIDCRLEGGLHGLEVVGKGTDAPGVTVFVKGTTAVHNKEDGFTASGHAAHVTINSCRAHKNGDSGFVVWDGGQMVLGGGNVSSSNGWDGFLAVGAVMNIGSNCTATGNDCHGYAVEEQARMQVGIGCIARDNHADGYHAEGTGSLIMVGRGSSALRNGFWDRSGNAGFYASNGAQIVVEPDCRSLSNKGDGYRATSGATLKLGCFCAGNGNEDDGYTAVSQGVVQVGRCCVAHENKRHGFLSEAAYVTAGSGCRAIGNALAGFSAGKKGVLMAGCRCLASKNEFGFHSVDNRSSLTTDSCCRAEGNKDAGFIVERGATLLLGRNNTAALNGCDTRKRQWSSRLDKGIGFKPDSSKKRRLSTWLAASVKGMFMPARLD